MRLLVKHIEGRLIRTNFAVNVNFQKFEKYKRFRYKVNKQTNQNIQTINVRKTR